LGLTGCGTLYLAQAANGQWHVLAARRPIDAVLTDPRTSQQLRDRLTVVRAARNFASTDLHLPDNRSYRTYADIKRPYVVWNVVATPEFSVEPKHWCFPIAGCVTYRGYFSQKKARAFAAELAQQGFDVTVGGVPAYSTLGKFADPVLSSMMRYGDSELVAIIFHELAHQLLYVKNDTEFNEAFATTVEDEGLRRWLEFHRSGGSMPPPRASGSADSLGDSAPDGTGMREFLEDQAKELAFVTLFSNGRKELAHLYASGVPPEQMRQRKVDIFARLTTDAHTLQRQQGTEYYETWLDEGLNNAHLASIATYYECVPGFERLLSEEGGDLERFYAAVRKLAKMSHAERHRRLCEKPLQAAQSSLVRGRPPGATFGQ
jgi:predicted aminopeptidase